MIRDREDLLNLLKQYKIPYEAWGTGDTKTFENLYREIFEGESVMEVRDGKVFRVSIGSSIDLFCRVGPDLLHLREDRQVFADGRVKRRTLMKGMSIGEKMKSGESSTDAAWRALSEELGITEKLPLISLEDIMRGPVPSISFPGITTIYRIYCFKAFLPLKWFNPEGYVEKQADKTNYYVWELVPEKSPPA